VSGDKKGNKLRIKMAKKGKSEDSTCEGKVVDARHEVIWGTGGVASILLKSLLDGCF
jgi:hypothetical protein